MEIGRDKVLHFMGGLGLMLALLFLSEVHWGFLVLAALATLAPIVWEFLTHGRVNEDGVWDIRWTWFGMGLAAVIFLAYLLT